MDTIVISIWLILFLYILLQSIYTFYYLSKSSSLVRKTETKKSATLGDSKKPVFKLFIDGDSVGAGIGSTSFETLNGIKQDNRLPKY